MATVFPTAGTRRRTTRIASEAADSGPKPSAIWLGGSEFLDYLSGAWRAIAPMTCGKPHAGSAHLPRAGLVQEEI
jgi:hypothetical protein